MQISELVCMLEFCLPQLRTYYNKLTLIRAMQLIPFDDIVLVTES